MATRRPLSIKGAFAQSLLACTLAWASACGEPSYVTVQLTASHARPADIREVWSSRFRAARDRELLPIARANARLEAPGLALDVALRVPSCDPATVEAMRLAIIDLTTTRHALAIHKPSPLRAEALATALRETLGADVRTPLDAPGKVIAAAPLAALQRSLDGVLHVVERADPDATTLWVVDPAALDGTAVASAGADGAAVDVTFDPTGAAAMKALTDNAQGGYLVFVVDGAFALAPRVLVRVSHTLRLDLPPADAARAQTLARAIAAANLPDPPTLVSATATCTP